MEATRIILIRHGETAWNADTRIQGQLDIGLNGRGLQQAERTGAALADEVIDAVVSSDLSRARQTAEPIAARHRLPMALHTGLRERGFGAFEGLTWAEIDTRWPDQALAWRRRVPDFAPEGGESLITFRQRVVAAADALARQHLGRQVVWVAHGGVLDVLYREATRLPLDAPRTWALDNAQINRLLWTPQGFGLVGWGDRRHLEDTLDERST